MDTQNVEVEGRKAKTEKVEGGKRNRRSTIDSAESVFIPDSSRTNWPNKFEFVLTVLGYAVGIGNLWRYPYLCYRNGGGAFVIVYLFMVVVSGFPLYFLEACIGQFASTGCISMFRICPLFKGVGFTIVLTNVYLCSYYVVVISYPLMFLIKIMAKDLPWNTCNNSWNTINCFKTTDNNTLLRETSTYQSPAFEFFHYEILKISSGIGEIGTIVWPLFGCLLFSWICIYLCIMGGIKSIGKIVYFTSLFPIATLLIFLGRSVALPGAGKGLIYYIYPNFKRLGDLRVWVDAASQVCYSIGPGWGGIVSMASFNDFRNNALSDSLLVVSLNVIISILAGVAVFSILGYLSHQTGISIDKVSSQGPSLAFITYPEAISLMPVPHLWAALFFFMLIILGSGTILIQVEAIIRSIIDEYKQLRLYSAWVTLGSCIFMFLISASMVTNGGLYILILMDSYAISLSVIIVCLIEAIIIGWIYGSKQFCNDIYFMTGKHPATFLTICWKYITPLVLVFVLVTNIVFHRNVGVNNKPFPVWAEAIGWTLSALSILFIPVYALYKLCKRRRHFKKRLFLFLRQGDWCPVNPVECELYKKFLVDIQTDN